LVGIYAKNEYMKRILKAVGALTISKQESDRWHAWELWQFLLEAISVAEHLTPPRKPGIITQKTKNEILRMTPIIRQMHESMVKVEKAILSTTNRAVQKETRIVYGMPEWDLE
jgi:hypothetical protein